MILRLVILATALVGCIPNNDDLQLGSGKVSLTTTRQPSDGGYVRLEQWPIASAWASDYYDTRIIIDGRDVYPGYGPNGYGGFEIVFSPDTLSAGPPTCRDRARLTTDPDSLDLHGVADGKKPRLATGDVPFVTAAATTYASFDTLSIDVGHVTITAVDDERITGTFEGTRTDVDYRSGIRYESAHVVGDFDVPICWN